MRDTAGRHRRAVTLLELVLVVGLLAVIAGLVMPNLYKQYRAEQLPTSARQMQSFVAMIRAHAQFDGKRYRIRFPSLDEDKSEDDEIVLLDDRQPIIEREDDPIDSPEVFEFVSEPWAVGQTLLGDVWCAEVRIGRPSATKLLEERNAAEDLLTEAFEDFDPLRPPLIIDPDGTSEWVTFVLTEADRDIDIDELKDEVRVEVICDGETGLSWLQRAFYEEELELFEERNWPVVLRQDYLSSRVLTEEDVLELHEAYVAP